ncbi:MAG: type-4 uracil-DNA glycosylase [Candidatus Undinarchaeales archaeon]
MSEKMQKIDKEIINCKKCRLSEKRTKAVPGEGPEDADILFIGEGPGRNEDQQGKPFVGKAGDILDELLDSINLERASVYITNVVKCRPPGNRNPKEDEIKICTSNYLERQIQLIKPKLICPMGNFASEYILEKYGFKTERIGKIHGKEFNVNNLVLNAKIIPLYHPAAATYNPNMKSVLKEDFEKIKENK